MIRVIIFIMVFGNCYSALSQEANDAGMNSVNVYKQALETYLNGVEMEGDVFLDKSSITTDSLPQEVSGLTIKALGFDEVRKKCRKKPFFIYKIIPIRVDEGEFYVTIIKFKAEKHKKNKRRINYIHHGGRNIYFYYDCEREMLVLRNEP